MIDIKKTLYKKIKKGLFDTITLEDHLEDINGLHVELILLNSDNGIRVIVKRWLLGKEIEVIINRDILKEEKYILDSFFYEKLYRLLNNIYKEKVKEKEDKKNKLLKDTFKYLKKTKEEENKL